MRKLTGNQKWPHEGPVTPAKLMAILKAAGAEKPQEWGNSRFDLDQLVVNGGICYVTNGGWAARLQVGDVEANDYVKTFSMDAIREAAKGEQDISQEVVNAPGVKESFPKVETHLLTKDNGPDAEGRVKATISIEFLETVVKLAKAQKWENITIGVLPLPDPTEVRTVTFERSETDPGFREIADVIVVMPMKV